MVSAAAASLLRVGKLPRIFLRRASCAGRLSVLLVVQLAGGIVGRAPVGEKAAQNADPCFRALLGGGVCKSGGPQSGALPAERNATPAKGARIRDRVAAARAERSPRGSVVRRTGLHFPVDDGPEGGVAPGRTAATGSGIRRCRPPSSNVVRFRPACRARIVPAGCGRMG